LTNQLKEKNLIFFNPSIEGGGVEKNLFLLIKFISGKIKNCFLITANNEKDIKRKSRIQVVCPSNSFWNKKSRILKTFISLIYLIKLCLIKKNVVIFSFQSNLYALIIAQILRKKIIIRSNASTAGYINNPIKRKIFSFFFSLADVVICNSNEFKKNLKKDLNIESTLIYNPNYTKEEVSTLASKKIKNSFYNKKYLNILNVGRLVKQKDQITLLKAFSKLLLRRKARLIIMGNGSEKKNIVEYILLNKIKKNVKLLNYQKNPYPYINSCDIFVLTSLYEGLPNVLIEAMSLKKFIISTNCPTGPKEILRNGEYGDLIKLKDHINLYKKLIKFNKTKAYYKKKIHKAYKSLDRFDYFKNCNEYLKIVNSQFINYEN
jgi:glycosyltransferase involved in cell wall biosynthesis